jgi:hypothetical protein
MEYDYVPLPQRQPLVWPNGARVALMLTFNLETWDLTKDSDKPYYAGGPAILPDRCRPTRPISPITPGANMASAWASGACSTCSTSWA